VICASHIIPDSPLLRASPCRHHTFSAANAVDVIISPFEVDSTTELITFVNGYADAVAPGGADNNIPSYNFRLCITQNKSNLVPFNQPDNYNSSDWEIVRRYVNACKAYFSQTGKSCQLGFPSCNQASVPNGKFDMNNCGGVSSDYIGGSQHYPNASWPQRKQIWHEHL